MKIVCHRCFLFRLSVRHVCRMNTQVRLLNSLVRLAGRVNSDLDCSIRNTERMIDEPYAIFTVQFNTTNTFLRHTFFVAVQQNLKLFHENEACCMGNDGMND